MIPLVAAALTLVSALCGLLAGMSLRRRLPQHHFDEDSRDLIKTATALMTTMAALLLSLQLFSSKGAFDAQEARLADIGANVVLLDKMLQFAGEGNAQARKSLRTLLRGTLERWPHAGAGDVTLSAPPGSEVLYERIQAVSPQSDAQRQAKQSALELTMRVAEDVRATAESHASSAAIPLMLVEIFWITIIFVSLGMFAPRNSTSMTALLLCAVSLAIAIYFIDDMGMPYTGLVHVSDAPLKQALEQIAR